MYRIKEKIAIAVIIIITILIAFIPMIIKENHLNTKADLIEDNKIYSKESEELNNDNINDIPTLIKITLDGEVREKRTLEIPYGYTYGYVINKNMYLLNSYSLIDESRRLEGLYEDTVIYIGTIDDDNVQTPSGLININLASKDELITLYGIGAKRAERIITYRNNKKIESYDELKEVIEVSYEIIEVIKKQTIL